MTHLYSKHSEKGFTLVETLVAITILLLVITGPLTISMTSARSTDFASEQVVAFFLAQEGAELAQKARDEIMLPSINPGTNFWTHFADSNNSGAHLADCYNATGCGLEIDTGATDPVIVKDCTVTVPDPTPCKLNYNSGAVRSRYTYSTGAGITPTKYTRTIKFEKGASDYDVKVISTVTWRTGNLRKSQEVTVETSLFDIYEN
ncbi:MAG: prepilin-type N-terminal cleavage/methylation domain-containing protein [Candidatus Pacebacteria bacterium]|nr:prepilin-type N-terminal cleavage/methylation domain-containing protein [Candidatus Paceibacterota bacterium]